MLESKINTIFYLSEEINIKDIDREIYTEDKKIFHLFFFHNIDLSVDKETILKKAVLRELDKVEPDMSYDEEKKTLTMLKVLNDFTFSKLDDQVDIDFKKHMESINYRISCILDTYKLFSKLYNDKTVIFLMPEEISQQYIELLKKEKSDFQIVENTEELLSYYDIVHWANYFSRVYTENNKKLSLSNKNITKAITLK